MARREADPNLASTQARVQLCSGHGALLGDFGAWGFGFAICREFKATRAPSGDWGFQSSKQFRAPKLQALKELLEEYQGLSMQKFCSSGVLCFSKSGVYLQVMVSGWACAVLPDTFGP